MLSPGENKPGDDTREASDHLFRALARLVPDSGIQFLDLTIPRAAVDGVARQFHESKVRLGAETVWTLSPLKSTQPADPVEAKPVLHVAGRQVIAAALDRWLPLPVLRFVARDGNGRARFDQGPFNWVRLFVATPDSETAPYRAVVAFDTRTRADSRLDQPIYIMPTQDDVQFASTFALTDDAEELAPFLAEDWVQDWVRTSFPIVQPATAEGAPHTAGLQQMAGYLTLLSIVRRAGVMPSIQFFDSRPAVVAPVPVDIVVDLGTARTCALLVESSGGRPQLADATLLALRDLARPTQTYAGAFESRVAFDRPNFGDEALSRKSGRADAFHWPSLARTGTEAVRLSTASRAADGAVGLSSPKAHLADVTPRDDTWRFTPDPRQKVRRSHMITGRLLAPTPAVTGLLTGPASSIKTITQRPRHALSAMTSFQIAEVVMQALSVINAPALAGASGRREAVRWMRQLILTAPLTMPRHERDLLRDHATAAIDMLWSALDWDGNPQAPDKPLVRLGLDETLASQLVYLFDAIAHRCGGDARAVLDVLGKSRPDFGVQPCLRVGALDCGSGHTTMTIVTYATSQHTPIQPKLLGAQRSRIAGGAVLDRIVQAILLPQVAAQVTAAGGEHALAFLDKLVAPPEAGSPHDPVAVGTRLNDLWLRPAALALLDMTTGLSSEAQAQVLTLRLGDLAASRGDGAAAVAAEVSVAIEAIRAAPIDLAATPIKLQIADIDRVVRSALQPMIESLSRALLASDCDVVLLTGWLSRHPALTSLLMEHMPWRPDRFVGLGHYDWQDWYPMAANERTAADGKDVALVGALLALAGGERLGFGIGESGFPFAGADVGEQDGGWSNAAREATS